MDKELLLFVFFGMIVLFILVWKPLRRRFSGWAILTSYLLFSFAATTAVFAIAEPWRSEAWPATFVFAVTGIVGLVTSKRPTEQRPTVAWMVVNGLWDQLAKEGLPAAEIERLKRLTPEERAGLMAAIRKPALVSGRRRQDDDDHVPEPFRVYGSYWGLWEFKSIFDE